MVPRAFLMLFLSLFFQITQAESDSKIQNDILLNINAYRQSKGLNPLKMDKRMIQEARIHSEDMARHKIPFGHQYFLQRIQRLRAAIKNSGAGAENVAYNYKDGQDVVKNWLKSRGHKANIDGHYNLTGIGIARDARGKIYFTQIFLQQGGSRAYANHSRRFYLPFIHLLDFGQTAI